MLELAEGVEPVGRIHIEKINEPFLSKQGCGVTGPSSSPASAAIEQGWLDLHESRIYVRLMPNRDLLGKASFQFPIRNFKLLRLSFQHQ